MAGVDLSDVDITEVSSNVLTEFLEVAFHLILYIREVYPAVLFERRRKYSVPVYMCVHPELCQYIRDVLDGVRTLLKEGHMEGAWLTISSEDNKVVEKFVFDMKGLNNKAINTDGSLLQLEQDLRAMLLKISVVTNTRAAETMGIQQTMKNFPWVTTDHSQSELEEGSVVPLKSVSSSLLQMQLHVIESTSKPKAS